MMLNQRVSNRPTIAAGEHAETVAPWDGFPRSRILWGILGLACLAACGREQEEDPGPRPPVILISVDTLRADHLGCYGYERDVSPAIDRLAADGTRFDNAVTPRPLTAPSMASALTGLYAYKHGVWTNGTLLDDSLVTLAERLRVQGYDTAAFISNYVLIHELSNLQQGFLIFDDRLPKRELNRNAYERVAEDTVAQALAWLTARKTDAPPFLWLHLMDPHGPYTPPAEYLGAFERTEDPTLGALSRSEIPSYQYLETLDGQTYLDRYDAEIAYADAMLGRLLTGLRDEGLYDSSLILFHADHGESLGENGAYFRHGQDLYAPCSDVPLILKLPKEHTAALPAVTGVLAGLQDLTPTVLDVLGMPIPPDLDGHSLLELARTDRRPGGGIYLERLRPKGLLAAGLRTRDGCTVLTFRPNGNGLLKAEGLRRVGPSRSEQVWSAETLEDASVEDASAEGASVREIEAWMQRARAHVLGFEPSSFSTDDPNAFIEQHNHDKHEDLMKALGYSD